jgi:RNA polymerase sigma-70 factor (ECF subfamily)
VALRRLPRPAPPSEPFAQIDRQQDAVAALATLSPRQRAALVLVDVMDVPAEEAARMLGIRTGTVRGLASRARATLRRRLEDE